MIGMLQAQLATASGPSRELDCLLHEVMTGQVDLQKDRHEHSRQLAREFGHMLVDLGSERLEIAVPTYTADADKVMVLLNREHGVRISYNPPSVIEHGQRFVAINKTTGQEVILMRWMSGLWLPNKQICDAGHNVSMALCLCMLAVAWKMAK